jgi:hypothetical protein
MIRRLPKQPARASIDREVLTLGEGARLSAAGIPGGNFAKNALRAPRNVSGHLFSKCSAYAMAALFRGPSVDEEGQNV